MEISLPRRTRPVLEQLRREDGGLSARALAQRMVRRLQGEGETEPGSRLAAVSAPEIAAAAAPLVAELCAKMGARFVLTADPTFARERFDVTRR